MSIHQKNICTAYLAFLLCLNGCNPSTTVENIKSSITPSATARENSPTVIPIQPDLSPSPTAIQYEPALKFNSWEIVHDLVYSPDGKLLAVSAGEHVHIYDAATLVEKLDLQIGAWANRLAFHPFQPLIVLAVRDGSIQFWDTSTGGLNCLFTAHEKGANSLAISPDGSLLATTGTDITSRLWDISSVATGSCEVAEKSRLIGESFSAPDVAFNVDGGKLALVDLTKIRLRKTVDLKLIATLPGDQPIFDIAFSTDDRWLATAAHHDTINLWDLTQPPSPHLTQLQPPDPDLKAYIWRVAISPDSLSLAAGASNGTITLWDLPSLNLVETFHLPRAISALSFSPDGKYLAAGGLDAQVWLYHVP
jgi:WD40 repeat protein